MKERQWKDDGVFSQTIRDLKNCRTCERHLPLGANPIFQLHPMAQILIASQAPGSAAHNSGIPFQDPSGKRLRSWLGVNETTFYQADKFAIMPMAFCYPGRGRGGDLPPSKECAPLWHDNLLQQMPNIRLTLVIGKYAITRYMPHLKNNKLTDILIEQDFTRAEKIVLPHPSPRNNIWLKKAPWFEEECVPKLQQRIATLI